MAISSTSLGLSSASMVSTMLAMAVDSPGASLGYFNLAGLRFCFLGFGVRLWLLMSRDGFGWRLRQRGAGGSRADERFPYLLPILPGGGQFGFALRRSLYAGDGVHPLQISGDTVVEDSASTAGACAVEPAAAAAANDGFLLCHLGLGGLNRFGGDARGNQPLESRNRSAATTLSMTLAVSATAGSATASTAAAGV